jgi:hypothetical protein
MAGLPAAVYGGLCTGHGICIPANVHSPVPCSGSCTTAPKKSIATMNPFNIWPPFALAPLNIMQAVVNVTIGGGGIPILDQDLLTNHPATCTNLIVPGGCKSPPVPIPCPTATLCVEDIAGAGAHIRKAFATTKSVWINGRRACRVADPLGPPCLSLIAFGVPNVYIGV